MKLLKCPSCGYYGFTGTECHDCGYARFKKLILSILFILISFTTIAQVNPDYYYSKYYLNEVNPLPDEYISPYFVVYGNTGETQKDLKALFKVNTSNTAIITSYPINSLNYRLIKNSINTIYIQVNWNNSISIPNIPDTNFLWHNRENIHTVIINFSIDNIPYNLLDATPNYESKLIK